ncbi:MAG: hypothetical protein NT169_22025 [Chloroflexi bacterium]|nr:hypothetical protein [Chloroflexota bacterium]
MLVAIGWQLAAVACSREIAEKEVALRERNSRRSALLNMCQDDGLIVAMFGAGARGYILKGSRSANLMHDVRIVVAGGGPLTRTWVSACCMPTTATTRRAALCRFPRREPDGAPI